MDGDVMDDFDPVELERVRRHGRPDWRRFVRPDWERYVHPAGHAAMRKQFALWDRAFETPRMRRQRAEQELQERAEQIALERKLAAIEQEFEARERAWEAECAARKRKADLAWERLMAAFMRGDFARKANFNPDQPRDELGRWTDTDGGGSGINDSRVISDATPDNAAVPGAQYAVNKPRLPPTLGHNNPPPDVPNERPLASQQRNSIVRGVAASLRGLGSVGAAAAMLAMITEGASWLRDYHHEIVASADPAKSLSELNEAVSTPRPGTHVHHINEQKAARDDGFSRSLIDAPDNLVRIPTLRHREITSWYQTRSEEFGGLSPRDWLRGKSWDERTRVGLDALIRHGVLKP